MLLERLSRFFRKSKKHQNEAQTGDASHGCFANASNFIIHTANMVDRSQTMYNMIISGSAVLDRLFPYTCPDAATDALVRSPPPRCLPGTREKILEILNNRLIDNLWMIFWLNGPAGTGKSAVAQTFAEMCAERGRLGGAYFFIRSSDSHYPRTLIPTLAYQLAVNVPDFQNVLGHAILQDPSIFHKVLQVQLQKLIVQPFKNLQERRPEIAQNPFFIIIDGLDECKGIGAQCEIVEMIGEVVRLKKDLPLRWLIASRPEFHLQYTFSQPDFAIDYHKESLLIDADTKKDVNLYLRHDFENIRIKSSIKTPWPSELELRRLEVIASGLFILAATIVRYVSDVEYGNPQRRLRDFFAFIDNEDRASTTNPLGTLDQLYTQILSEIPKDVYPITKRILVLYIFDFLASCNVSVTYTLLRIDQDVFHDAVKKLHSLFDIPPRGVNRPMRPHHASFGDYLRSRPRSGKFHVSYYDIAEVYSKNLLFWYKTMLKEPYWVSDDSFSSILKSVSNTGLPGVVWDSAVASYTVRKIVANFLWPFLIIKGLNFNAELLGGLEDFDFRYMLVSAVDEQYFSRFIANWRPYTTLLHPKPQDQLEETLLHKAVSEVGRPMEPAMLPMVRMKGSDSPYRYVLIGRGIRCCLFWFDENCDLSGRCRLSCKVLVKETYTLSDCVIHFPEDIPW